MLSSLLVGSSHCLMALDDLHFAHPQGPGCHYRAGRVLCRWCGALILAFNKATKAARSRRAAHVGQPHGTISPSLRDGMRGRPRGRAGDASKMLLICSSQK